MIFVLCSTRNYYLDAILNCDSMSKYELLIGLEGFPAGTPGPWYRAILTGFSVSSVIALFTLFSLVYNVALRHNQVLQCDSIPTLKFNDVNANLESRYYYIAKLDYGAM